MPNTFWDLPYPSCRQPVLARNIVATSQPLAAQAGLRALQRGGNAVDAALATAITLTVVEPTSTGIGGDAFAIVWDGRALHAYNGSGRAPAGTDPAKHLGKPAMPAQGWDAVTVPGQVAAWADLSAKFGKLAFADLFTDAIAHARDGFLVSPVTAGRWQKAAQQFGSLSDFAAAFLTRGRAPQSGELFRCPAQAETLAEIAATRGESFYRGRLAGAIAAHARATGGVITEADLDAHRGDWVQPSRLRYRGHDVCEIPPNTQGIAALLALGILERCPWRETGMDSADAVHWQLEAMKLAAAETQAHVADAAHMRVTVESMLAPSALDALAARIRADRALPLPPSPVKGGGTVYLTAADAQGMMVSYIQSNFRGFGSGIVIPGTGISLQNRGCGFSTVAGHPNAVAPGKRPFHTIIPAMLMKDGAPVMSFGVMGGEMQPQGHVQMVTRVVDYGRNPQAAADAPRWFVAPDGRISLEDGWPAELREELSRRGHVLATADALAFGGAQLIYKLPDGYCGASDPRKDGQAVGC